MGYHYKRSSYTKVILSFDPYNLAMNTLKVGTKVVCKVLSSTTGAYLGGVRKGEIIEVRPRETKRYKVRNTDGYVSYVSNREIKSIIS